MLLIDGDGVSHAASHDESAFLRIADRVARGARTAVFFFGGVWPAACWKAVRDAYAGVRAAPPGSPRADALESALRTRGHVVFSSRDAGPVCEKMIEYAQTRVPGDADAVVVTDDSLAFLSVCLHGGCRTFDMRGIQNDCEFRLDGRALDARDVVASILASVVGGCCPALPPFPLLASQDLRGVYDADVAELKTSALLVAVQKCVRGPAAQECAGVAHRCARAYVACVTTLMRFYVNAPSRGCDETVPFAFDAPPSPHDLRVYLMSVDAGSVCRSTFDGYTLDQKRFFRERWDARAHALATLHPEHLKEAAEHGLEQDAAFPVRVVARVPSRIAAVMRLSTKM